MGLIGHGFAFGLGYTLGSATGRGRLAMLCERANGMGRRAARPPTCAPPSPAGTPHLTLRP